MTTLAQGEVTRLLDDLRARRVGGGFNCLEDKHLDVVRVHEALEQPLAVHPRLREVVALRFLRSLHLKDVAQQGRAA